ncbi:phosphoadenylyl-sulfate reductase, partial [Streptomyces sp. NPDC005408]
MSRSSRPTGRHPIAEQAGRDLEDASALEILKWAADTFGPRFCVT